MLANLIRLLATRPFFFETEAPKPVQLTLFDQRDRRQLILHMVNFQQELPNIPVYEIAVRVWMAGRTARRVSLLPDRSAIPHRTQGGHIEFTVPKLESYAALCVQYR